MIPKKIHYVWVGGKPKPSKILKCMKTWRRLKGYEIIEWNESNFDIDSHPFVRAAYDAKKWAYVSDYIRAWAIYHQGGVYFDTDILVLQPLDELLNNRAFVGYERSDYPFTAVFGAEKGHPLIKKILDYYDQLEVYQFDFENNNTISVSNILINDYQCQLGNVEQVLDDDIHVYPDYFLCNPSLQSYTVHVFMGSWLNKSKFRAWLHDFLRMRMTNKLAISLYLGYLKIKRLVRGSARKQRTNSLK